ncbi:hypothetical protein V8E36_005574 [Tilletia maclaganii]
MTGAPRRCGRGCRDPDNPVMRMLLPCNHNKAGRAGAQDPALLPGRASPSPPPPPPPATATALAPPDVSCPAPPVFAPNAALAAAMETASTVSALAAASGADTSAGGYLHSTSSDDTALLDPELRSKDSYEEARLVTRRDSILDSEEDEAEEEEAAGSALTPFQSTGSSSNEGPARKRSRVNANQRADPKIKETEGRKIWLNLSESHSYATKNFKFETNADERARVAKRSSWRLIEQGAKLSARTGQSVIIAFGPLTLGNHGVGDHVYVSPNLCDPARPTLRSMAENFSKEFKQALHAYREAGRAHGAKAIEANKLLIAEKANLLAEPERLKAEVEALRRAQTSS